MQTETTTPESRPSRWDLGRDRTPRLVLRPRVLLAEGETDMRNVLRWALRRDGCDVIESQSGEELLDYISTALVERHVFPPPDLIVVDADIPGIDALEVIASLRRMVRKTPIIIIAEKIDERVRKAAEEIRVEAIFEKPFDLEELRETVRAIIAV